MHAGAAKLLWDAQRAGERAVGFTRDRTFDDYRADDMLCSAVERQLAIVGEAHNQLRRVDEETAAALPELKRVIGFRNVLVHGDAGVDVRIFWGIVQTDLPGLLAVLTALLA